MGFLDKLMGHGESHPQQPQQPQQAPQPPVAPVNADEAALARYRYMLQTAPPDAIEQAHAEAFAKLTPQQRQLVLQQLSAAAPPHEPAPASADPQTLARMATRAEIREPGIMERMFGGAPGGGGGGIGTGGILAGSLLTSLAGGFIGSAIADHFFRSTPMGQAFGGFGGGGMGMPGETTNIYNTYEDSHEHEYKDPDDTKADDLDSSADDSTDADDSADDSSSDDDSGTDDSSDDSGDDSGGYDDGGGGDDQST